MSAGRGVEDGVEKVTGVSFKKLFPNHSWFAAILRSGRSPRAVLGLRLAHRRREAGSRRSQKNNKKTKKKKKAHTHRERA